jgi:cytochrome P450
LLTLSSGFVSAPEAIDGTYDPFEEFNRSVGAGVVEDPYPLLAMAREKGPVLKENLEAELLADGTAPPPGPEVFTAFSYDAVQTVLRDGETFSSAGYADVMGAVMGHTILEMDEPEHHTYRGLVQQAFSRKAMERWETEAVGPIVDECIDAFVDRGQAELVRELTLPFPVNVIARMLGLPRQDLPQFHRWAIELISVSFDWDRGTRASAQLRDYFARVLADRRAHPADDLMSTLAVAELDGQHLTDEEIFAFLRLLLPAGAETTYRSSSNLLFGLLTNPDQLDALRADRTLMPQAIEEGLRWEPPLTTIVRTATRDTVVDGVEVPSGSIVITNMGSANHDEKYWERSEEFDIHREQRQHLAFAFGPHMCLGMHLARMETRVVLERIFDRLPNLRLDPAADAPNITGMTFRAPPALPVNFG